MDPRPGEERGARTFPACFLDNVRRLDARRVAFREKDYGLWQSYTWQQSWAEAEALANGLAALGMQRGDRVCIVGDNRPQLYWAMLATQALGGVPVPLYQDSIESEMEFIVSHAEARFAIVEDQEQADKLIHIKPQCPQLEYVVYDDARGMRSYAQPWLVSYEAAQSRGREWAKAHPGYVEAEVAKGEAEDVALVCYTSGTTGRPKGVMLTHANFLETSRQILAYEALHDEVVLAYLPMAWVGDFFLSFALSIVGGFTVHCPESSGTVLGDMREVGPTYFFAPPRIWENLLTSVMIRMEDAAWIKRRMFHYFINLATRLQRQRAEGQPISALDRLCYEAGRWLVYAPLKDRLGLGRIRIAYTAGEAIGPEIFEFFRALGINLKQLYGSTEASVFIALQRNNEVRSDTVGPPMPWVDLKLAESGEVLFRSPGLFKGYLKNEEATREAFEDGYFKTGDAGIIDHNGHLRIIDRVKDVTRLASGTMFAPKYLENKLKFSPYIKEAVAIGQDRPYVTAMINIDLEAVGNWAERRNLSYSGYTDLAQKPQVYDLIAGEVVRMNATLADDEQLRDTQVRKFLILHKELDPDDNEITRTRKLRRGFIAEKYRELIEALYGDAERVTTEVQVTFEDGRQTTVRAELAIRDLTTEHGGAGQALAS